MNCKCYPKLSYFFGVDYADSFGAWDFYTYGLVLGIFAAIYLYAVYANSKSSIKVAAHTLIVHAGICFAGNLAYNFFMGAGLLKLSTAPVFLSYFLATIFWPKGNTIAFVFLICLAGVRLGCHLSGDGHWGSIVAHDSYFYDEFKNCKYPRNIINEGVVIPSISARYNRVLEKPRYPLALIEFVLYSCVLLFCYPIRQRGGVIPLLFLTFALIKLGTNHFFLSRGWLEFDQVLLMITAVLTLGTNQLFPAQK